MSGTHDPLWFKNAVIYQILPRAFFDSNGDGVGDFPGITGKLDYIEKLGVNAIWVQPFFPSPLRDGGYDIADYVNVADIYGSLDDARHLIDEAHQRGIRVIFELVINHTSDQHPWFQAARNAPKGSPERDFYVWSDSGQEYPDARIIFLDSEQSNWTWDEVAGQYFWHRFFHHQPDLNFDNPAVQEAVFKVMEFWVELGVDGFRLDAIPYLFEREGTTCENLPETHAFLKQLRKRIDARNPEVILLAEANQWPEDTRPYFGDGDECHMNYNFPLMPRLYMAIAKEDRSSIIDILEQTPEIPGSCQWAMFLRNHDELTLEMVTEEERDYMWRVYSPDPRGYSNLGIRRRLAPLVENDRRRIELLNSLLLSMPGTPVLYYGDEIGMGDNFWLQDRDGVRTPMQWDDTANGGFSAAPAEALYLPVIADPQYQPGAVNVAAQEANPNSLLWWMRHILALRQEHPVFGRGSITLLNPENTRVLAYTRNDGEEAVLVVANLSRNVQSVELDLSGSAGQTPVDLFGGAQLRTIGTEPYSLTLAPYGFYWLSLTPPVAAAGVPVVEVDTVLFDDPRALRRLEKALPAAIVDRRWFGSKSRCVLDIDIIDAIKVPGVRGARLLLTNVTYSEGEPDSYLLPVREVNVVMDPSSVLVKLHFADESDVTLIDGCHDAATVNALLRAIEQGAELPGARGTARGTRTAAYGALRGDGELVPTLWRREGSNSSIAFGDRLMMKVFRRPAIGSNPDWELGRYLTDVAHFPSVPRTAGGLEYVDAQGHARTLAIVQELLENEGDARQQFMADLRDYFAAVSARQVAAQDFNVSHPEWSLGHHAVPALAQELFGAALQRAELLGRRTAEMHLAFAGATDPALSPMAFTPHYQRSLYQSTRQQLRLALDLLARHRAQLEADAAVNADRLLAQGNSVFAGLAPVKDLRIAARRMRVHGDYHLEQVLVRQGDYLILDFEGEPSKSLSERRIRLSPLKDVAGMLRSFDYAARPTLDALAHPQDAVHVAACTYWTTWMSTAFLSGYQRTGGAELLPEGREASEALLRNFLLEKAAYEVVYELNNRPSWVGIPLRGIMDQLA